MGLGVTESGFLTCFGDWCTFQDLYLPGLLWSYSVGWGSVGGIGFPVTNGFLITMFLSYIESKHWFRVHSATAGEHSLSSESVSPSLKIFFLCDHVQIGLIEEIRNMGTPFSPTSISQSNYCFFNAVSLSPGLPPLLFLPVRRAMRTMGRLFSMCAGWVLLIEGKES